MDDGTVDRIFAGGLGTLPPVSSKIVRIFTSSTFTDTSMERNTLMAEVYPKLKEYCREKHGLEFQVVDMRWGVRDEATDDHMTTELCMKEIDNCQRLSMGPNFVVFLGQKYGYRPIPTYILSSELALLRETLVSLGSDVSLLDMWYKKDTNAVPPVSILQPISSILVNFNNKRVPKLQQQDQAIWWDTLEKMQKLFRKAAQTLNQQGKLSHDAMHNYFMSVTEREVIRGILNVRNTKNHCLAYVRIINNINLQNLRRAGLFIDIANRAVDAEAVRLLANLRDERLPNKIEQSNHQKYTVDWIGRDGLATDTHEEYLQHFIQHFYRNIARLVDRAMRKEDSSPQGQIITEILQHLHACNNAVKVFVGREPDLEKVKLYITGPFNQPLVLYGSGGCGKTSLLAKSASLVNQWLSSSVNANHDADMEDRSRSSLSSTSRQESVASNATPLHGGDTSSGVSSARMSQQSQDLPEYTIPAVEAGNAPKPGDDEVSGESVKPVLVTRFLGTTPDSSALTPMLLSICQQISYNYLLPFEAIPDDVVPLTAYMKQLLSCATKEQPLLLFLDSVDQIGGAQDANKMTWLPTKLPPHCKIVVSCVNELENPEISRDYQLLRRMIDTEENFIELSALGEDLAMQVIRQWMRDAHRDLTNYQWRVVSNALGRCSLPIFVKLVFAEINRWKSFSRAQETHLASNVMDSIMMLFERIEIQHGRILVFHALAYITASRSGLSESELEDLLSLDDRVLDDVYQYHMPPVRRIPPLLWTRIRNDLPNYLSEREADGVSVLNWYHRQFKEAAKERYFKNVNMAIYFHSSIAEYFLANQTDGTFSEHTGWVTMNAPSTRDTWPLKFIVGNSECSYCWSAKQFCKLYSEGCRVAKLTQGPWTWGGGQPKPFKFTEIQRMRFNLTEKEGEADRKVPLQPLVFYGKDGTVSRYNLRKFGELPYHLIRARRFDDLYNHVLFNYQWLHAKLSSCPLQAVLSDFEDACNNLEDRDVSREIMLVADALRLGGAILGQYPDMLAPQLIGRLLPEAPSHVHVKQLLEQCDREGPQHCALLPAAHCMHTPGGPLKYSLEGHQFAVFGFCLTSDYRYVVSVSNRFLTWDLSTSDLTRAVNPGIEGVFQGLVLSPDNRFAAAWTNNGQTAILNLLTSELALLSNPFKEETVKGAFLLDTHCFVWSAHEWALVTLQGQVLKRNSKMGPGEMHLLSMDFTSLTDYTFILWTGQLDNKKLQLCTVQGKLTSLPLELYNALVVNRARTALYACADLKTASVTVFHLSGNNNANECVKWVPEFSLEGSQPLLQLKLSENEDFLLGTTALGFQVWDLDKGQSSKRLDFLLPAGVRNISVKLLVSNSVVMSKDAEYAIAGVRKNLYVWNTKNSQLVKTLDAHFGRILALAPFTAGPWNSVITSSIDRTVKVWNINHIFEQVHVIDRHELQIESICVCQRASLVVTVTRGCVGVWQLQTGKLIDRLADSALGAIVTHAVITRDGKYIISAESGNVLIWDWTTRKVVFKTAQPSVKQLTLLDGDDTGDSAPREQRFLAASRLGTGTEGRAVFVMRELPTGIPVYEVECPVRSFRPAVFTGDGLLLVSVGVERNRDTLFVFQAATGLLVHKFCPRRQVTKECLGLKVLPGKAAHVALMDQDKGVVFDVRSRRHVRTIRRWTGPTTQDGRYALYAPSRGGLELIELKHGTTVFNLIPRIAEGMFSNLALFDKTDQYVMYYHSGRRTVRLFRVRDGAQLADYRLPAELSSICSTDDGRSLIIGTVDGCLAVLCFVDPAVHEATDYLANLPSRLMLKGIGHVNVHNSSDYRMDGAGHGNRPPMSFRTAATVAAAWAQANALSRPASARAANKGNEKNSQACTVS